ncbi:hypothetical protein [Desulfosporosinus burensis]
MRSSCQTRALSPDGRQGTRPKRRPCRMAGGTHPCVPPCYESGLKPSLATTHAKAFAPCDRDPLHVRDVRDDGSELFKLGAVLDLHLGRVASHLLSHAIVVPN